MRHHLCHSRCRTGNTDKKRTQIERENKASTAHVDIDQSLWYISTEWYCFSLSEKQVLLTRVDGAISDETSCPGLCLYL
jgi:hypothetical protein